MKKSTYLWSEVGRMILLLFLTVLIAFLLITHAPVDPLTSYIGTESTLSDTAKQEIVDYWGLDDPAPQRFFTWIGRAFHGDLGESITYKRPVTTVIAERFSYSLVLMLVAWVFSGIFGFLLGIVCGRHQGSPADRILKVFALAFKSAPTFWLGLLVLTVFSIELGWFPIGMASSIGVTADEVTLGDKIYHLILPALTLTLVSMSDVLLYTRQKFIETMNSDYILYARARGETEGQIVRRHVLRNISLPAITVQFASFSELFGGMALAENVFSYPGIGTATTAAATNGDAPLLMGIALFSALFVFVGNLIANLLYGVVDPRMREGAQHA